jgi:hypothetical protein
VKRCAIEYTKGDKDTGRTEAVGYYIYCVVFAIVW